MANTYTIKITLTNPCGEGYTLVVGFDPGWFAGQNMPDAIALLQFLKQQNLLAQQTFRLAPLRINVEPIKKCGSKCDVNLFDLPLGNTVGALSYMYGIWYVDITGQNQQVLRFSEFFESFLGITCPQPGLCCNDFCVQIALAGCSRKSEPCPVACCPSMPAPPIRVQGVINDPFVQVKIDGPVNNVNRIICRINNMNLVTPQELCDLQCRCIQMENQLAANIPNYVAKLQGRCQAQYTGPVRAKQAIMEYNDCGEMCLNYDLFYVPCAR